ncbi:hypothetical protein GCK72_025701 [Caenorhabditis remanei]|uniref:Uncharacterized protein n=1 Tax=Caenorhabditis remanei TaxID=31234 RepID=A0A6A5G3N9_CAERE|nr:hypothetical protein GCK72_025701 [Caenorhabditis remanei]KAF1749234.1 hypothetical protein GCK72_025701 [Caenorhabditis remanei]
MGRKKVQKEQRKVKGTVETSPGPIKVVDHPPDATWTVDKNGHIDILHHACQFKKHFKITGIDKQFHNVWRSIPRFCESCGQHMKYILYNGKVVELKDQIVAPPLWWW